jgi:hypothetical protein
MCPSYLRALLTKPPSGGKSTTRIWKFQYEPCRSCLASALQKALALSGLRRLELFEKMKIRGEICRAQVGAITCYSIIPEGAEFDTLEAPRAGTVLTYRSNSPTGTSHKLEKRSHFPTRGGIVVIDRGRPEENANSLYGCPKSSSMSTLRPRHRV